LIEEDNQFVKKKVGLINASDYGFGALQSECSRQSLIHYNNCKTWLTGSGAIISNSEDSDGNQAILTTNTSGVVLAYQAESFFTDL